MADTVDTTWLHRQAGIAVQFDYQDKGQIITVDYTTVLGQVPEEDVWIVRVDGQVTDRGEYWWPVTEFVAIGKKEDGTPVVDDATDKQLALVGGVEDDD